MVHLLPFIALSNLFLFFFSHPCQLQVSLLLADSSSEHSTLDVFVEAHFKEMDY